MVLENVPPYKTFYFFYMQLYNFQLKLPGPLLLQHYQMEVGKDVLFLNFVLPNEETSHPVKVTSEPSSDSHQISELVIAYSILIREISVGTFVDGSVRFLAARLAVLLVKVVISHLCSFRIPLRALISVGEASILGVLTFHENISHLAVQLLSQDSSREKN